MIFKSWKKEDFEPLMTKREKEVFGSIDKITSTDDGTDSCINLGIVVTHRVMQSENGHGDHEVADMYPVTYPMFAKIVNKFWDAKLKTSPDGERMYIDNKEVELAGICENCGTIAFKYRIDDIDCDFDHTPKDTELYETLCNEGYPVVLGQEGLTIDTPSFFDKEKHPDAHIEVYYCKESKKIHICEFVEFKMKESFNPKEWKIELDF